MTLTRFHGFHVHLLSRSGDAGDIHVVSESPYVMRVDESPGAKVSGMTSM